MIHVAPLRHPLIGGVEDVVKRTAEHRAGRGHEVHVVTYSRSGGYGSLRRGAPGGIGAGLEVPYVSAFGTERAIVRREAERPAAARGSRAHA